MVIPVECAFIWVFHWFFIVQAFNSPLITWNKLINLKSQWSAPTSAKDEKTQKATLIRKRFLFHVVDVWKNNKPRESSHENILTILHDKKDTFPNGVKWLIAFLLLARVLLLFNDS